MPSIHEKIDTTAGEDPPPLTPTLARLHRIGHYDTRTFAVAILELVVRGCLEMTQHEDGTIRFSGTQGNSPETPAAQGLLADIVQQEGLTVGRNHQTRLIKIRDRHLDRLGREGHRMFGDDDVFFMAGIGIFILLLILAVAATSRQPFGASAFETLLPFWPVAALSYGALFAARSVHMRKGKARHTIGGGLDAHKQYTEVTGGQRLDPRFTGFQSPQQLDQEALYAVASGAGNALADPLIHLLETILPEPVYDDSPHGTNDQHSG